MKSISLIRHNSHWALFNSLVIEKRSKVSSFINYHLDPTCADEINGALTHLEIREICSLVPKVKTFTHGGWAVSRTATVERTDISHT